MKRTMILLGLLLMILTVLMAVACSDEETGEWEPVPDDDDDDGCGCEVPEEQWQALLDECDSAVGAVSARPATPVWSDASRVMTTAPRILRPASGAAPKPSWI